MPREAHYELTDTEKRDLIKLIEQGTPLLEKYRFLLVDQNGFETHQPKTFAALAASCFSTRNPTRRCDWV